MNQLQLGQVQRGAKIEPNVQSKLSKLREIRGEPAELGRQDTAFNSQHGYDEADKDLDPTTGTLTDELVSARYEDQNDLLDEEAMQTYQEVVRKRRDILASTNMRFAKFDHLQLGSRAKRKESKKQCCQRSRLLFKRNVSHQQGLPFSTMSAEQKDERIKYLWFRLKCASIAIIFIGKIKQCQLDQEHRRMTKLRLRVYHDDEDVNNNEGMAKEQQILRAAKTIWYCVISFGLWFNMISTPFLILWPELSSETEFKKLYYLLWLNELVWLLDIVRKPLDRPKKSRATDIYENAIAYFKSTLILDVISLLPQVTSGLNNKFAPLKLIRIYQIWLLHYPLQAALEIFYAKKDKRQLYVVVYATQTICKIFLLLHYLAIVWIWIGSDNFADYEPGFKPWQLAIEDFHGYSKYRLYIFSVYWVCTVVTTVGYGDYAGKTTLELEYSFLLEFFGIVVFSMLQVAVQGVVNHDASYGNFVSEMDNRIAVWLLELETSNFPTPLPEDLYQKVRHDLWRSFRRDHSLIVEEFRFYGQLPPKLQAQVVRLLFGNFLLDFQEVLRGCEPQFINNIVVMLRFTCYHHGQVIQTPMYEASELHLIQRGGIAVCESSSFGEPVLVYTKGAVINLYQILMKRRLDFKFVAVSTDSFVLDPIENKVVINYNENNKDVFTSENYYSRILQASKKQLNIMDEEVELHTISGKKLLKLCDTFPKTAEVLQSYAIQQMKHLDTVRRRKEHLHPGNYSRPFYRKNQLFFDRKADVDSTMGIDIQTLNSEQKMSAIEYLVNIVCERVDEIEDDIYMRMQALLYKVHSLRARNNRRQKQKSFYSLISTIEEDRLQKYTRLFRNSTDKNLDDSCSIQTSSSLKSDRMQGQRKLKELKKNKEKIREAAAQAVDQSGHEAQAEERAQRVQGKKNKRPSSVYTFSRTHSFDLDSPCCIFQNMNKNNECHQSKDKSKPETQNKQKTTANTTQNAASKALEEEKKAMLKKNYQDSVKKSIRTLLIKTEPMLSNVPKIHAKQNIIVNRDPSRQPDKRLVTAMVTNVDEIESKSATVSGDENLKHFPTPPEPTVTSKVSNDAYEIILQPVNRHQTQQTYLPNIETLQHMNLLKRNDGTEPSPIQSLREKLHDEEELSIFKNSYREIVNNERAVKMFAFKTQSELGSHLVHKSVGSQSTNTLQPLIIKKRRKNSGVADNVSLGRHLNFYQQEAVTFNSVKTASFASEHLEESEGRFQRKLDKQKSQFINKNAITLGLDLQDSPQESSKRNDQKGDKETMSALINHDFEF